MYSLKSNKSNIIIEYAVPCRAASPQFVHIAFDEQQIECEILNIKFPKVYKIYFK